MRLILVGDPHVRQTDLEDADKLLTYARSLAHKHDAGLLFLGDLYHHHGVIHSEVMRFWYDFFRISKPVDMYALVGNHDKPGVDGSFAHSLLPHKHDATIVEDFSIIGSDPGILCVAYCSNEQLIHTANLFEHIPTLICHATFEGAQYENGIFAKDGINPDLIPQKQIISGHIHTPHEFGKVWYPGAPRALTSADANIERFVWLVEFENGLIVNRTPFSLREVCRQVYRVEDTPDWPIEPVFDERHKYHVDIIGPASWITERKPLFEGKAQIRTIRTDKPEVKLRESEGIGFSFQKFLAAYQPQYQTPPAILQRMVKERIGKHV